MKAHNPGIEWSVARVEDGRVFLQSAVGGNVLENVLVSEDWSTDEFSRFVRRQVSHHTRVCEIAYKRACKRLHDVEQEVLEAREAFVSVILPFMRVLP